MASPGKAPFYDAAACSVTPDDPRLSKHSSGSRIIAMPAGANDVSAFGSPTYAERLPCPATSLHPQTLAMEITGDWHDRTRSPNTLLIRTTASPGCQCPTHSRQLQPRTLQRRRLPMSGGNSTTWAGGWSIGHPAGSQEPRRCLTFIKWFAGEEGQAFYTKGTSHLPTIESTAQ